MFYVHVYRPNGNGVVSEVVNKDHSEFEALKGSFAKQFTQSPMKTTKTLEEKFFRLVERVTGLEEGSLKLRDRYETCGSRKRIVWVLRDKRYLEEDWADVGETELAIGQSRIQPERAEVSSDDTPPSGQAQDVLSEEAEAVADEMRAEGWPEWIPWLVEENFLHFRDRRKEPEAVLPEDTSSQQIWEDLQKAGVPDCPDGPGDLWKVWESEAAALQDLLREVIDDDLPPEQNIPSHPGS